LSAGGDVQKGEFVGALLVVAAGDLNRIAGIAQIDEIDALDDAAGGDVQAGNDAFGEAQVSSGRRLVAQALRRGEVQRAFVDGAAGDGAHDALVCNGAAGAHVVEIGDAAAGDHRNMQGLGQPPSPRCSHPESMPSRADVGVDDRRSTP
jgi:hypothetical protein